MGALKKKDNNNFTPAGLVDYFVITNNSEVMSRSWVQTVMCYSAQNHHNKDKTIKWSSHFLSNEDCKVLLK